MSILYKPVKIESAEQAEALPDGTMAQHPEMWSREKYEGRWHDGTAVRSAGEMTGWTALVPIEAEEEFGAGGDGMDEDFYLTRRLVTPWEAS